MDYGVNFNELGSAGWTFFIAYTILSIGMMFWAYRRKGMVGLLFAFFLNGIGWIIVLFLPRDDKKLERERRAIKQSISQWSVFSNNYQLIIKTKKY